MKENMFKVFFKWLRGKKKDNASSQKQIIHESSRIPSNDTVQTQFVPYDENLLERSRTQWQFGAWESLAQLNRETLQNHPDRAKLVLLAAAGLLQLGSDAEARQCIHKAQEWGCRKSRIAQVLVSGAHNSLGKAFVLSGDEECAKKHFKDAIISGSPYADAHLLAQARNSTQRAQVGYSKTLRVRMPTETDLLLDTQLSEK